MRAIDFYFDFSSPYGFIASLRIEEFAEKHGLTVNWRPFLLGFAMQQTGSKPAIDVPMKGDYLRHDLVRCASENGVHFTMAPGFPFNSMPAVRAYYWLHNQDPVKARSLAQALLRAAYVDEVSIVSPTDVAAIAQAELGIESEAILAAVQDPEVKSMVKAVVTSAMEKKVFGSPFFIVDGESFWGHDRLPQMSEWLNRGGWPAV